MRNASPWLLAASTIMALGSLDTARAQANGDPGAVQGGTAKAAGSNEKAHQDDHSRKEADPPDRSQGDERDRR